MLQDRLSRLQEALPQNKFKIKTKAAVVKRAFNSNTQKVEAHRSLN